jgi:hypothetical protein
MYFNFKYLGLPINYEIRLRLSENIRKHLQEERLTQKVQVMLLISNKYAFIHSFISGSTALCWALASSSVFVIFFLHRP